MDDRWLVPDIAAMQEAMEQEIIAKCYGKILFNFSSRVASKHMNHRVSETSTQTWKKLVAEVAALADIFGNHAILRTF